MASLSCRSRSLVFRRRLRTFDPRGVPEIHQHLGSHRQATRREVKRFTRSFSLESPRLLQRINLLNKNVRLIQITHVIRKRVLQLGGSMYSPCEVCRFDIGFYVFRLEQCVNTRLRGVSIWIWANPAVVVNRGMEWLGGIANIMAQPSCIKDDCLLYGRGRL